MHIESTDKQGVFKACKEGHTEVACHLIQTHGAKVDSIDEVI